MLVPLTVSVWRFNTRFKKDIKDVFELEGKSTQFLQIIILHTKLKIDLPTMSVFMETKLVAGKQYVKR